MTKVNYLETMAGKISLPDKYLPIYENDDEKHFGFNLLGEIKTVFI